MKKILQTLTNCFLISFIGGLLLVSSAMAHDDIELSNPRIGNPNINDKRPLSIQPDNPETKLERKNKALVLEFMSKWQSVPTMDIEGSKKYLHEDLITHGPMMGEGVEGFIDYLQHISTNKMLKDQHTEITLALAAGNYVTVVSNDLDFVDKPDDHGWTTTAIFRIEGDKIIEHWETVLLLKNWKIPNNREKQYNMW